MISKPIKFSISVNTSSQKRDEKRDSHQIYLGKIPQHTVGTWRALGCGLSLEHCCLYKSINSFRAKTLSHSPLYLLQASSRLGMYACSYVCMCMCYVRMYIGMLVFRYVVPKMKKMCINVCWNNLKTDFKTPENDLSHFKNVFPELGSLLTSTHFWPLPLARSLLGGHAQHCTGFRDDVLALNLLRRSWHSPLDMKVVLILCFNVHLGSWFLCLEGLPT